MTRNEGWFLLVEAWGWLRVWWLVLVIPSACVLVGWLIGRSGRKHRRGLLALERELAALRGVADARRHDAVMDLATTARQRAEAAREPGRVIAVAQVPQAPDVAGSDLPPRDGGLEEPTGGLALPAVVAGLEALARHGQPRPASPPRIQPEPSVQPAAGRYQWPALMSPAVLDYTRVDTPAVEPAPEVEPEPERRDDDQEPPAGPSALTATTIRRSSLLPGRLREGAHRIAVAPGASWQPAAQRDAMAASGPTRCIP